MDNTGSRVTSLVSHVVRDVEGHPVTAAEAIARTKEMTRENRESYLASLTLGRTHTESIFYAPKERRRF